MADIVGHNWMKGETATDEDIQKEFNQRLAILKKSNEMSQEAKAQAINCNMNGEMAIRRNILALNNINYTANDLNQDEEKAGNFVKLDVKTFKGLPNNSSLTFTDESPAVIFKAIAQELGKEEINVLISKTKWRLTYTQQMPYTCLEKAKKMTESAMHIREQVIVQVTLLQLNDDQICAEFKRNAGSVMLFNREFKRMRKMFQDQPKE